MPNTNPEAIRVANERGRPYADRMGHAANLTTLLTALAIAEGWFGGGSALFPADDEVIVDGSAVDGRAPVTNNDLRRLFLNVGQDFTSWLDTDVVAGVTRRDLILKVAVNPIESL